MQLWSHDNFVVVAVFYQEVTEQAEKNMTCLISSGYGQVSVKRLKLLTLISDQREAEPVLCHFCNPA